MDQKLYAHYRQFIYSFANRLSEINKKVILYVNDDGTKLRTEIKLELHEKIKELRTYNQRVLDDLKFDFKENDFDQFNIACDYYIEILNIAKDVLLNNIHETKRNEKSLYYFVVVNNLEGEYVERFELKIWDFELFTLELVNRLLENIEKLKKEISNKYQKPQEVNLTKEELQEVSIGRKLKWNGKPSQFGFLILELIGKGWIERPAKSHKGTAEYLLQIFDIDTTIENLENEINQNKNSLTIESQNFLKLKSISSTK